MIAQIGVLILSMFVVPKLMAIVPDFDPLMLIIGVFGLLALLQHLGLVAEAGQADGQRAGARQQHGRKDRSDAYQESEAQEVTVDDLLQDAERCIEQNSYSKAQELARQAADLDPECAKAWELLATALKWDGKREEAAATVHKALRVFEVQSAGLQALEKELERKQDDAAVAADCLRKGEEFIGKRQYDLATECLTQGLQALDNKGDDSGNESQKAMRLQVLRRRAECAQQLQDWGMCRRDATVLLEADPSDQKALLQRAAANEALERYAAGLEDARKLLAMDPKSSAANRIVHNCQQALRHQ
eukprot:gnl/TRDRNA2_/TRDRNA2_191479_c0_seq1.p1 gnl/TRDRNA2_/TRDRNA2_191479_c0~~gnl/TRDRNA2_/TRDRNA2_191479_c0_seq1.p1  ORF type:complete len:303 (-),score=84.68 gnl/TRDRNA2_/TRDRNA2_191479_c0_seq1:76-984(-)